MDMKNCSTREEWDLVGREGDGYALACDGWDD